MATLLFAFPAHGALGEPELPGHLQPHHHYQLRWRGASAGKAAGDVSHARERKQEWDSGDHVCRPASRGEWRLTAYYPV